MVIIPDKGVLELDLNGSWEFLGEEPGCVVQVPGDLHALGVSVVTDKEYEYRRQLTVPEEFRGKRIFLELASIHDDTEIIINKKTAAVNRIPYMDCRIELTQLLTPGETADLTLRCISRSDSLSSSPRLPGTPGMVGFIHNMRLTALEQSLLTVFRYETLPDGQGEAMLKLHMEAELFPKDCITGQLFLNNRDGRNIFSRDLCMEEKGGGISYNTI